MTSGISWASVVELNLVNIGVCHESELVLSRQFQRRFQYFYYALFTACLLTISVLYALIYRSVLARRSRRHKQKTATLAVINSSLRPATVFDAQPDNCEQLTMKVHAADTEARKLYMPSVCSKSVNGITFSTCKARKRRDTVIVNIDDIEARKSRPFVRSDSKPVANLVLKSLRQPSITTESEVPVSPVLRTQGLTLKPGRRPVQLGTSKDRMSKSAVGR